MDVQTLGQLPALGSLGDPNASDSAGVAQPTAAIPDGTSQAAGAQSGLPAFQLPHEVAKIFTGGAASHVAVSFQVAHSPNEIVTVFKNTVTGEIISQVPSEIMIKIAEFFDQVAGVVLDRTV